jgi:hypothetical protein
VITQQPSPTDVPSPETTEPATGEPASHPAPPQPAPGAQPPLVMVAADDALVCTDELCVPAEAAR